jgi:molecular chaperone GrpE
MAGGKRSEQESKGSVGRSDGEGPPAKPATTVEAEHQKAESEKLKDRLLRALAECENVRRRGDRQASDARRSAIGEFAKEMLTVADNLHRAIEAATAGSEKPAVEGSLVEGVRATERTLTKALEKFGVQRIRALGVAFDPQLHEAVQQSVDDEHPPGTIVQVVEDGYVLGDRLLRPTRAIVAGPQPARQRADGALG